MKTIEYHTHDKSTWGDGPWQTEPDKMQFPDPETGLPCLIVRNQFGALCGYVGVPATHKYFGVTGWDFDVEVHGGITFTDRCQPHDDESRGVCHIPEHEGDNVWWLGFDCGHCYDVQPGMEAKLKTAGHSSLYSHEDTYRDIPYVKGQIASLAKQLAQMQ